jgi:RHS repeat-associated protein
MGGTEVTLAAGSATPRATRYYDLGDGNQAIRTDDNKVYFVVADSQGTGQLQIDGTGLAMQERRSTPFGTPRGTPPASWSGDKGFVGGTSDPGTGLTHLGARDYDPATGRFTSVDPELDSSDPQSLNGYAYAGNSPVTQSDPTGLYTCRNGHEGCNEHGNACGSDCSAWATQAGDCVHTECSNSKVNQNPQVSLKQQRAVTYARTHCDDLCGTLGITSPKDPEWQDLIKDLYGGSPPPVEHDTYAAEHAQEKSVAFTPHPSYSYVMSEYIGPNSLGTPEEIMAYFKAHPHEIFPFPVSGCDAFTQGAHCLLHPAETTPLKLGRLAGGPGPVTVSFKDKTSFTFTVTGKGYFDDPGSQITFSISSRKGGVYLTQKGHTTGSSFFGWLGVKVGVAKSTWQQQARNLTNALQDR